VLLGLAIGYGRKLKEKWLPVVKYPPSRVSVSCDLPAA